MLSIAALRLAAIEALCPTAALHGSGDYPTMARERVFDSRAAALDDLETGARWTPVLAIYSEAAQADSFGEHAQHGNGAVKADLVVVAELAVRESDADGDYADAAQSDPDGRLMLDALCAQVRRRLLIDPAGFDFRSGLLAQVDRLRLEPYSVPNLGIRWMRTMMTFSCAIADDGLCDAAGLPAPISRLMSRLPVNSYALDRLALLADAFNGIPRVMLGEINLSSPPHGLSITP